jgi:hypothetical protein
MPDAAKANIVISRKLHAFQAGAGPHRHFFLKRLVAAVGETIDRYEVVARAYIDNDGVHFAGKPRSFDPTDRDRFSDLAQQDLVVAVGAGNVQDAGRVERSGQASGHHLASFQGFILKTARAHTRSVHDRTSIGVHAGQTRKTDKR